MGRVYRKRIIKKNKERIYVWVSGYFDNKKSNKGYRVKARETIITTYKLLYSRWSIIEKDEINTKWLEFRVADRENTVGVEKALGRKFINNNNR